jgi:hypothetical protein
MPELLKLGAQLMKIINLAVENDDDGFVFVADRLLAAGDVDDGKARDSEANRAFEIIAIAIRPAVADRGVEPPQEISVDILRRVESELTADTAHKLDFVLRLGRETTRERCGSPEKLRKYFIVALRGGVP